MRQRHKQFIIRAQESKLLFRESPNYPRKNHLTHSIARAKSLVYQSAILPLGRFAKRWYFSEGV